MPVRYVSSGTQRTPVPGVEYSIYEDPYDESFPSTGPSDNHDLRDNRSRGLRFGDRVDGQLGFDIATHENEPLNMMGQRRGFDSRDHQGAYHYPNNPIFYGARPTARARANTLPLPYVQSPPHTTDIRVPRSNTFSHDKQEPRRRQEFPSIHRERSRTMSKTRREIPEVPSPPPPTRRSTTMGYPSNHPFPKDKDEPTLENMADSNSDFSETTYDPGSVEIESTTDPTNKSKTSYDFFSTEDKQIDCSSIASSCNESLNETLRLKDDKSRHREPREASEQDSTSYNNESYTTKPDGETIHASIQSDFKKYYKLIREIIRQTLQLNKMPLLYCSLKRVYFDQTQSDKDHAEGGWKEMPRVFDSLPDSQPRGLMGSLPRVVAPVLSVSLPLESLEDWQKGALRNVENILKTPDRRKQNETLSQIEDDDSLIIKMAFDYGFGDWVEATCVFLPETEDPNEPGLYTTQDVTKGSPEGVREWSQSLLRSKFEYENRCHRAASQQIGNDISGMAVVEIAAENDAEAPRERRGVRSRGTRHRSRGGGGSSRKAIEQEPRPRHSGQPQHHGQQPQFYKQSWDEAQSQHQGQQWYYRRPWPEYTYR